MAPSRAIGLASRNLEAPSNPAAGSSTCAYDLADRLISWTAPSGPGTNYGDDAAGGMSSGIGPARAFVLAPFVGGESGSLGVGCGGAAATAKCSVERSKRNGERSCSGKFTLSHRTVSVRIESTATVVASVGSLHPPRVLVDGGVLL